MDEKAPRHIPVLPEEVIHIFEKFPGGILVDGTVGMGGHAALLLQALGVRIEGFIGIDQDPDALEIARKRLIPLRGDITFVHGNFRHIAALLPAGIAGRVGGILLDLGFSGLQIDLAERGFSFQKGGPLDMRMNRADGRSAFDVVNEYPEEELTAVLRDLGEVRGAGAIARAIVRERSVEPIRDTERLARAAGRRIPARKRTAELARVFQAIRIEVNDELDALRAGLQGGLDLLAPGGVFAVIAYHSLEDRIVKKTMVDWARGCICPPKFPVCRCGVKPAVERLGRRAVKPGDDEVHQNNRARSARLRAVVRLGKEG